jgi:Uma2 family endonuclease
MQSRPDEPPIHRINVAQFHRMLETGVLTADDRVELIDGEMRDMPPIGPSHSGCTIGLTRALSRALGDRGLLSVQGPLALDAKSELYPDLMVLRPRDDLYQTGHPHADDVLLLIEVSDTTLDYDRRTKLRKYAQAGVARYWIIDVQHRAIHEYQDPDRFAYRYRQSRTIADGTLTAGLDGIEVAVDTADLFRF